MANAPYVNGDPSIGRAGSIPPAASIEYPQREIVNVITNAGLTPTNSDLNQLGEAIQSGKLIYADDTGVANIVTIALLPVVTALTKGMVFIVKIKFANTGPTVLVVNGVGGVAVVHPADASQLGPGELYAGAIVCFAYDGTYFQLAWSQKVAGAQVTYLTASRDYYVGGSGASDANDGTSATLTGGHGPFFTLQRAMNVIAQFNLNGFNITIHIAVGTYASLSLGNMAGNGAVNWVGVPASPTTVIIHGTGVSALIAGSCGSAHTFNGVQFESGGTYTNDPMCGVSAFGTGTSLILNNIAWGVCSGSHYSFTRGATVIPGGIQMLTGAPQGANAGMPSGYHAFIGTGSILQVAGGNLPILSITTPITMGNGGAFMSAFTLVSVNYVYASITGAGNVTGQRYLVQGNSIVSTNGGGINYFPGTIAGTTNTGGQYS